MRTPLPSSSPTLKDYSLPLISALVACSALILYVQTLYLTLAGGDSGELTVASYVLGTVHPPGYPLYTMIGHLFTMLPINGVAWRMNFMSAVMNALAAGFLTAAVVRACRTLFPSKVSQEWVFTCAGVFAGGLFAFSANTWRYSTQAEVFPLNDLFVAVVFYLSASYVETRSRKYLYWGSGIAGWGLFHHQTFLFCALPFVTWLAAQDYQVSNRAEKKTFGKRARTCALLFCSGFIPYAYLVIADASHPSFGWGDLSHFRGFMNHILRREYGTFQLGTSDWKATYTMWDHLQYYFETMPQDFLKVGFLLALPGLWFSKRKYSWFPFAYFAYILVFTGLANSRLELPLHRGMEARFFLEANLFVYFWCGIGAAGLLCHFSKSFLKTPLAKTLLATATLAILTTHAVIHYAENDQSKNHIIEDYGRFLLRPLEPNAILISTNDISWGVTQYLQLCEGFRTDVHVIPQELLTYIWMADKLKYSQPAIKVPGDFYLSGKENGARSLATDLDERYGSGGYSMLEFLNANAPHFPVYLQFEFKDSDQATVAAQYERIPIGLADRILSVKDPSRFDRAKWVKQTSEFWAQLSPAGALAKPADTWENLIGLEILIHQQRSEQYRQGK